MGGASNPNSTSAFSHDDAISLYLALTLILLVARVLGEISKKLNQPAVMGELLAGVLLGKTLLGTLAPQFYNMLFGPGNKSTTALAGVTSICVTMYMLVAGLEMNLENSLKKKSQAFSVGFFSLVVPFALGFLFSYYFPEAMGKPEGQSPVNFSMFLATAMAITALPVVAKTLRDLHLFSTDLGVVVMSAAVFDDILGWSLFAVTLAISKPESSGTLPIAASITISILYVIFVLTAGTWLTNKGYPYIQAYFSYPAGELGFIGLFALASSTFALWVGLHNTLGAFIAGAAVGNTKHFRHEMRESLDLFVSFMLAPIFFGAVCIPADFVSDFDPTVVFSILFLSILGKVIGGFVGAKLTGQSLRDSMAVAVCMNARGAMELILAQVALEQGIISGKVFVALVFMAIFTSIIPGPMLRRILKRPTFTQFISLIKKDGFHKDMIHKSLDSVYQELTIAINLPQLAELCVSMELSKPEPCVKSTAICHVLSPLVKKPIAAIGVFHEEFIYNPKLDHSAEYNHAKFVILIVIPEGKTALEFDLLTEVYQLFMSEVFRKELSEMVNNRTELRALTQIQKFRQGMAGYQHSPIPVLAMKGTGMASLNIEEIIENAPPPQLFTSRGSVSPRAPPIRSPNTVAPVSNSSPLEPSPLLEPSSPIYRKNTLKYEELKGVIEDVVALDKPEEEEPGFPSYLIRQISWLGPGAEHDIKKDGSPPDSDDSTDAVHPQQGGDKSNHFEQTLPTIDENLVENQPPPASIILSRLQEQNGDDKSKKNSNDLSLV